jgi:putative transposase
MCKLLRVSSNSYYTWLQFKDIDKTKSETVYLKKRIKAIFNQSNQIYGSVRTCEQLKREGLNYHRSYIALLMKEMGLKSVLSKKFRVCTTDSNHSFSIAKNVLNRDFKTKELGHKWVSDITYIRVKNKWNYVTTIIDLADRKLLAWTISHDMTTENTVYKTWLEARKKRNITDNHIFHSDRGVQYASNRITSLLEKNKKITQSMSRKGNCWDNAVAESFFKTLKYECTNRHRFRSIFHATRVIDNYMKWYNNERLHSAIKYKTPAEKEIELTIKKYKKIA